MGSNSNKKLQTVGNDENGVGGLGTVSASSHEKACLARRPSPPPAPPSPLAQAL